MLTDRQRVILAQYVLSEALGSFDDATVESDALLEQGLAITEHVARWPRGDLPVDVYMLIVAGFLRLSKKNTPEQSESILINAWNCDAFQRVLFELSASNGDAASKFADELFRGLPHLKGDGAKVASDLQSLLRQSKLSASRLIAEPTLSDDNVAVLCAVFRCAMARAAESTIEAALIHTARLSESVLAEVEAQSNSRASEIATRAARFFPSLRDPFYTKEIVSE